MRTHVASHLKNYEAELLRYVDVPGEAGLLRAYEIGREAATTGKGILQLSDAHHRGLSQMIRGQNDIGLSSMERGLRVSRSADFFAESLASFEMVYQGYRRQILALEEQEQRLIAAREDADRANQAKSEFLSGMSHELRTPLTAIMGFGQLLAMDELSTDQHEAVRHIRSASTHLLDLINEVLETSQIESGHLALRMEPVSVGQVVRETLELTLALAKARAITLGAELTAFYVYADGRRLKQVLLNLVSNAIKYNREGGTIAIAYERRPERIIRIWVTDTGYGIAETTISKLFMPFERLGVRQSEIEGTGLGLAMVKRFVEAMGGSIGVHSVEGEGTTFWIELSETTPPAKSDSVISTPRRLGDLTSLRTILYIEDNPVNAELVRRVLEQQPMITLSLATDGIDGVELAQLQQPDLILLDLNLPDISGEEVLRRLRADARTAAIPVVVVSADAMPAQVENMLSRGARAYLTKPFDVPHLLEVVRAIFAGNTGDTIAQ